MTNLMQIDWRCLREAGIFRSITRPPDGTSGELLYWINGRAATEEEALQVWDEFVRPRSFRDDDVIDTNVQRLISRAKDGMKSYGVSMEKAPGGPVVWIDHAIEELLDAANYLEKLKRTLT